MHITSDAENENFLKTGSSKEVGDVLDYCLWDGPVKNIPPHDDVRKWRAIFVARGPEFAECVANCDDFLKPYP